MPQGTRSEDRIGDFIARKLLPRLLLVVLGTGVGLVLAEAALRLSAPPAGTVTHILHPPHRVTTFRPTPDVMPGIAPRPVTFTTNSEGLRGDPMPAPSMASRILAVGGSTTEAIFLDDADAWPHVLQERLAASLRTPVWVGNAGKSGLTSFSNLVQIHFYARELHPRLIVLQAGANDLNKCISGDLEMIRDLARRVGTQEFFRAHAEGLFHRILPPRPRPRFLVVEAARNALFSWSHPPAPMPLDAVVQDKAGAYYVEQRRRRQTAIKIDEAPDVSECLGAFQKNLELIAEEASSAGIRLVLLTHGSLYRDDLSEDETSLLWFGAAGERLFAEEPATHYFSVAVMADLMEAFNRRTLQVCRERGLPCFEVDRHLPKTTESYYDDMHLNTDGSHHLANELARFLLDRHLAS